MGGKGGRETDGRGGKRTGEMGNEKTRMAKTSQEAAKGCNLKGKKKSCVLGKKKL